MTELSPSCRFDAMAAEDRAVIKQRALEVARRPEAEHDEQGLEVLEVTSAGQRFALPMRAVDGVVDLTELAVPPRRASFVHGLVSFRGDILLCVELAALTGGQTRGFSDMNRVVSVSAGGRRLAILADKTMAARTVLPSCFHSESLGRPSFVVGSNDEFLSLLDPAALIEHVVQVLTCAER